MTRAPQKTAGPRKANRRGAARLAAVQALYQMDMAGAGLNEILAQFESHWLGREVEGEQYLPAEAAFFREIVSGVVETQRALDPKIDEALAATWPLKRIEAILRSVLRAGAWDQRRARPARPQAARRGVRVRGALRPSFVVPTGGLVLAVQPSRMRGLVDDLELEDRSWRVKFAAADPCRSGLQSFFQRAGATK
jgi:N utilization substance protein B